MMKSLRFTLAGLLVATLSLVLCASAQADIYEMFDRVAVTSTATGTGSPIALGAAKSGPYQTFASAGVVDGETVSYSIVDGSAWETGTGVYTASGATLTRNVLTSSNANAAINLDGSETIFITATKATWDKIAPAFASTAANEVWAAPCSATGTPGFRPLCQADLPGVSGTSTAGPYTVVAGDMGGTIILTGTGSTLTIPAISTTVFASGMTVCYVNEGTGDWTISTTPTITNIPSLTLHPGAGGCLRSNGTSLDWFPGSPGHGTITTGALVAFLDASGAQTAVTAVPNGVTATTQAANSNDTKVATDAYADTSASNAAAGVKHTATIGWIAGVDPNNTAIIIFPAASTITSIVGNPEVAVGSAATASVYLAASGTACSAGTDVSSGSIDANGTAATNQTLTLTTTAAPSGDRLCLQTTGGADWTGGSGVGAITVTYTTP